MIKFFLDQHGCAKNQVDGELIITRLQNKGLCKTEIAAEADIIIINSCGFIESAKTESLNALLEAKEAYPDAKILLAGCLAERYAEQFAEALPEADGIFGNGDLTAIDSLVEPLLSGGHPVVKPAQQGVCCGSRSELLSFPGSAFVKITEGCDNRCSFCAIPLIRGNLRSRDADDIVREIDELTRNGIFEINLIGQDSAAYGMDGENPHDPAVWARFDGASGTQSPLARLLEKISALNGSFWLRLLYIHPDHFPPDILPVIARDERLLAYFDIPFQSGADSIIKAMNRTGSRVRYEDMVKNIRGTLDAVKDGGVSLRTTFLTGFPGETEDDAQETERFLENISPDWSGCFPYSKEDGTPAASLKKQVSRKIAEKRAEALRCAQERITAERLKRHLNRTYDVLIEEIIEGGDGEGTGLAIGRAWFQAPEVDGAVVVRYDQDETADQPETAGSESLKTGEPCPDAKQADSAPPAGSGSRNAPVVPGHTVKVLVTGVSGFDLDGRIVP